MTTRDIAGSAVRTDPEGFLLDGSEWTPEVAELLARAAGIAVLTDGHWKVLALCREEAARSGRSPDLERLCELSGFDEAELRRLFPGDPARLPIRIAGLRIQTIKNIAGSREQEVDG